MNKFDVIIIGGSYAGLSAAMSLGRSLRKVLIIDNQNPANKQTPFSHNFITQDGSTPAQISAIALSQVLKYNTVSLLKDTAIKAVKENETYKIATSEHGDFFASKVIIATGIKDILPDIKGLSECWGISVIHCPYCHGYEYKHQKTGLWANPDVVQHLAPLLKNLTQELTVFTNGLSFPQDLLELLERNDVKVYHQKIKEVVHNKGQISSVSFETEESVNLNALYLKPPFAQKVDFDKQLGYELNTEGYISVDQNWQTTTKGLFAIGDSVIQARSVANAVASGNMAGAFINKELSSESFY